ALALGDVANRARDENAVLRLQRTRADVHRKLGTVAPQAEPLSTLVGTRRVRFGEERRASGPVAPTTLRDEHLSGLSQEILARIAEEDLGLRVDQHDSPAIVGD